MSKEEYKQAQKAARDPNPIIRRLRASQVAPPWRLSDVFLALVVLFITTTLIGSTVAALVAGNSPAPPTASLLLGWTVGLILSGGYIFLTRRAAGHLPALKLGQTDLPLPIAFLVGVGAALTFDLVAALASGSFRPVAPLSGLESNPPSLVMAALFLVVAQPIVESLIFFGLVQTLLRAQIGPVAGWFMTGVAFTIYYFAIYAANLPFQQGLWYGVVLPLLLGLTLGLVRLRSASTRATIVTYSAYGLTTLLIAVVLVS